MSVRNRLIGSSVPRIDGRAKVTGAARYAGDVILPGMVHGRLVRSAVPHARLAEVDASAALRLPGVVAVLLPEDVAGLGTYGDDVPDRPVLAQGEVRFAGDPVAAVAALDERTAEEAAALVRVAYEELPAVFDVEAALAPGAPRVHPDGNVCARVEMARGDVEAALAAAAHVYEDEYSFPSVYQYALEPHTVLAAADDRRIDVWSSAQHPFLVRAALAGLFGLPLARVRVAAAYLGGGFGSKSYVKYEPVAVALARKAARPVRLAFGVDEAMLTNRRHGARVRIRTGVDAEGRVVGRQARILLDTGAYADNGPRVTRWAASHAVGPYRVPAFHIEAVAVYTHRSPAGSYRGIGQPQANWAAEGQMDRISADLGIDPAELRRRNLAGRGERIRPGEKRLDADLPGHLERLLQAADVPEGSAFGLACGVAEAGASPVSVATVRLHADGSATVLATTTELGQGARTVLAQVAAEELGIGLDRVAVVSSDTDATMYDRSTGASRSTTVMGRAVQEACRDALRRREALRREDGVAAERARREVEALEVVGRGYSGPHHGIASDETPVFWETGMGLADAEADAETGCVWLWRYVSLADIGRAIHPRNAEGQEEGAVLQGIGHTLFEELCWDGGALLNGSLVDYRVPTFGDLPERLEGVLVENGDGPGPFGGRGIGESGLVPVAAAIASCLRRRHGVRLHELPLTPERVWRAMRGGDQGCDGTDPPSARRNPGGTGSSTKSAGPV